MATVLSPRDPVASQRSGSRTACREDRLTRAEFERRYAAMPNVKKAELIEGSRVYALRPYLKQNMADRIST